MSKKPDFLIILVVLLILYISDSIALTAEDFTDQKGFRDPGKDARPHGLWNWLNGDITRSGITRDLEEAKSKGFGGLLIWDTPELASKNLFYSSTVISGPGQISQQLSFPEVPEDCPKGPDGMPLWHTDVAVLAWPDTEDKLITDPSKVLNISEYFSDAGRSDEPLDQPAYRRYEPA